MVGLAEAGLLPGILFYIGNWFPQAQRARANALFLLSLPLALVIGAPVSGLILQMDGLWGIEGWRWLFLLEGAPSILIGVGVFFILPDKPANATWLSAVEKQELEHRIDAENAALKSNPKSLHSKGAWAEVLNARVLALGFCYFSIVATANTLSLWTPQILNDLLGGTDRILLVSFLSMIPPAVAIVAMLLVSANSDRTNERTWHTIGCMTVGALGWFVVIAGPGLPLKVFGLCLCAAGSKAAYTTFWTMTTQHISRGRQAVGIALISSLGTLASIVSPSLIGVLRSATESFYAGIWYTLILIAGGVLVMLEMARADSRT